MALTDQQLKEIFDRTERESNRMPDLIAQLNENVERLNRLVPNLGKVISENDQQAGQP